MKNINGREFLARLKVLMPQLTAYESSGPNKPFFTVLAAFLLSLTVVLISQSYRGRENPDEFEAGRVAERDVIAQFTVSYEDVEATRQRFEAQERMVPAVFHYIPRFSEEMMNKWRHFTTLIINFPHETEDPWDTEDPWTTFIQIIEENFPGYFSLESLVLIYQNIFNLEFLALSDMVLTGVLERGIFMMPQSNILESFNPDVVELVRHSSDRVERERIRYDIIISSDKKLEAIQNSVFFNSMSPQYHDSILHLLPPFITENVFYSPEETVERLIEARINIEPVMKFIERGQPVIRKGFIITEDNMMELRALNRARENDMQSLISTALLFLLLFLFMLIFLGKQITGRSLKDTEIYLISVLSAVYIIGTALTHNFHLSFNYMPVSIFIPTALIIMLPAILIHSRLALVLAITLPMGAFFSGSFDAPSFIFALASGVTASFVLKGAEKRMDLVKAGLNIAGANCITIIAILLSQHAGAGVYPGLLFWAAFNGIGSGMLVLGFLPPLEHALNAATSFRLIELSDLNAPILRRLFTVAPGTYSHSIMVANLAESACQEIGANAVLARVGAYYHDLGKMETPYYFVENQADYNPHDDMAPRQSVTVIRNHVKLGVEKARQLGLPMEVIDIISEHHGNSIITWFYSKATKQEKTPVCVDDFSYQGNPPQSRESAVVMLADLAEAAVRSLDKPTPAKIEEFINELFQSKMEYGQLARSELTFYNLEIIKKVFIQVFTGYYHSRIVYPKIDKAVNNALKTETVAAE